MKILLEFEKLIGSKKDNCMFFNKKINYIFVSFGDEIISNQTKNVNKSFFLNKLIKKNTQKEEIIPNNESNIYELSEKLVLEISRYTDKKCFSFYLNLEKTHDKFIHEIQSSNVDRFYIFPLYPQYRSDLSLIANFFSLNLYEQSLNNFFWIKSFHNHPYFIKDIQKNIKGILKKYNLDEKETMFLFLANKIDQTSLYSLECEITCQNIIKAFQYVEGSILYFSDDFEDLLKNIISNPRKKIVIIPISTLIDDLKTLKNIEKIQTLLEKQNKEIFTCKTLNHSFHFLRSILDIIDEKSFVSNKMLTAF